MIIYKMFPTLKIKPPLFYNWTSGIRFELGNPKEHNEVNYMKRVYFRSLSLFRRLHSANDEIFIVADIHHDNEVFRWRKIKIFKHYIKSKEALFRLQHQTIPYVFEDVYDRIDYYTHKYILKCNVSDVKYSQLIKAICNHDMDIKPKIHHDVFFINITKGTIFHVYDDRGCDVIASSKESIRYLYEEYNDWILKYDKAAIDELFQ
ncbi:DUF3885 domain-containing protein [Siminovitchia fordii]|uniref:DUF3885 domain-containing protein n=1 Tax=Siminovitchia fordii TaxID=254759 RepID=A0ABQ4K4Z2_9BACI|nr:hypothetical protein J1TS3_19180 [Siminovitchia fordii]